VAYPYGNASKAHLAGVTPRLRDVYLIAAQWWNITIIDGIRTWAEQAINVRNGASKTMESRHLPQDPDNLSNAVDATVYPVDWEALERGFNAVKRADPKLTVLRHFHMMGGLKAIAGMKGIDLRQGHDWDSDGDFADQTFMDMVHSEVRKTS
jgi:hypothetical protein